LNSERFLPLPAAEDDRLMRISLPLEKHKEFQVPSADKKFSRREDGKEGEGCETGKLGVDDKRHE
jgi:hypothetical protein